MPNFDRPIKPSWIDKKPHNHDTRAKDKMYHTTRWRQLREYILNREPMCRLCEAEGRRTPAKVIDHKIPIQFGGDRWSLDNLQPLCTHCDNVKTGEDSHKYGNK